MSKPMNKLVKFVLIAGGIFIGLLAIAAAYIAIQYPPEKLKTIAIEKLSQTLHRNVAIEKVHFNVLSGFEITNLKVSNRPGWAPGNFVVAKDISISYHLFPLLWGQISLGEIKLKEPQILVERRGLDQFNFSDMMGGSPESAPPPAAAPPPVKAKPTAKAKKKKAKAKHKRHAALNVPVEAPVSSSWFLDAAWADTTPSASSKPSKTSLLLSVDSINISHGKVTYLDETAAPPQRSDLKDLNLRVRNISMVGGKTTISLSTPFDYAKVNYQLDLEGAFRYFLSSQSFKEVSVKGTVNGLGFGFSGDALNLTTNFEPNMDGNASLNMLQFSGLLPKNLSAMPEGLSLTGPAKVDFHLGGKLKSGLELSGTADASELAIKYKDLFVKTTKSTCKVDFKSIIGQDGSYDLPSYKIVYQDWEVTGAFHHRNSAPWFCDAHSKSLPFKGLPGMLPKLKDTTLDGGGSLDLSFTPAKKGSLPFNVNGKIGIKSVGISLPQEPYLQKMNGPILVTDNVIKIPSMTFESFDGNGVAAMTLNGNTNAYNYSFNLESVSAQKAVDASIDAYVTKNQAEYKDKLSGTLNISYSGAGRGYSGDEMLASQTGSGSYSLVKAKLKGLTAIKAINNFFKDKGDEMPLDNITGILGMKNKVFSYTANTAGKVGALRVVGGVNVSEMVYSPDMKVQCDLKREFLDSDAVKGQLMAKLGGKVPPQYTDKVMDYAQDDNGNIPIDFRFTGSVSKTPGLDCLDLTRASNNVLKHLAKEVEKAAQQEIQKKANEVGQDLGNKLKGLFNH